MLKRARFQNLDLFNLGPKKKRPAAKLVRIKRGELVNVACSECDQPAAYIVNERAVCKEHGQQAVRRWNAAIADN